MRAERDRAEVLVRVVGLDADALEPRPDVDPAEPSEPLGGLVRGGEVPRPRPARQRGRVGLALAHQLGRGRRARRCCRRPRTGRPAGRPASARLESRLNSRVVVGDPVEGRGREDGVDRLVELELTGRRPRARRRRRAARARPRPSPASRRPRSPRRAAAARAAPPSRARCRSRRRARARRRAGPAGRARPAPSPRAEPTCARTRRHSSRAAGIQMYVISNVQSDVTRSPARPAHQPPYPAAVDVRPVRAACAACRRPRGRSCAEVPCPRVT